MASGRARRQGVLTVLIPRKDRAGLRGFGRGAAGASSADAVIRGELTAWWLW